MPQGAIRIMGKWSRDEGESWSEPFVVRECAGVPNAMEASFLRLRSGRVLMEYMQRDTYVAGGDSQAGMYPMITHSDDECVTWSEPSPITGDENIYFSTNDRLLPLRTGRIVLPVLTGPDLTSVRVWFSDDEGATWGKGAAAIEASEGVRYGYPIAAELVDGRVAMFLVNSTGRIHVAHSEDGGDTWSPVVESGPEPCPATFMVRRLPESQDLLLIWNNHTQRVNLTAAVSRDSGETWADYRLLVPQERWPARRTLCFPSVAFLNGCAHMTWYASRPHPDTGAMFDLIYRRVPVSWFYGQ